MLGALIIMAAMLILLLWQPDLPVSRMIIAQLLRMAGCLTDHITTVHGLAGIGAALVLYAAVWGLQGDAPIILAASLPELAAWSVTFEIATLAEALIGVGSAFVALRASSLRNHFAARLPPRERAKRSRLQARKPANDDAGAGPGWHLPLAA